MQVEGVKRKDGTVSHTHQMYLARMEPAHPCTSDNLLRAQPVHKRAIVIAWLALWLSVTRWIRKNTATEIRGVKRVIITKCI